MGATPNSGHDTRFQSVRVLYEGQGKQRDIVAFLALIYGVKNYEKNPRLQQYILIQDLVS